MVIQESMRPGCRGPIVEELAEAYRGIPFRDGEKYAVFRAMEVASQRGFGDLRIRSDYNSMRRQLRAKHKKGEWAGNQGLDGRILELAGRFDRVQFGYVPRRKNHRAHTLARQARSLRNVCEATVTNTAHALELAIQV
jgi:ribonuclease HI